MTTTKLLTAAQFGAIDEDGRFDLIDGEVLRMAPTKPWHGAVAANIAYALSDYARATGRGRVFTAETGFLVARNPDSVLCPDASFVSSERLSPASDWDEFFPFAPTVAVEVLSPSERRRSIERKVALYLAAGSQMVWLVDPRRRIVSVHLPVQPPRELRDTGVLDGASVLPGFTLPLADIFR